MSPAPSPLDPPPCGEDKEDKEERINNITGKGLRTAVALSTASCFRSGVKTYLEQQQLGSLSNAPPPSGQDVANAYVA